MKASVSDAEARVTDLVRRAEDGEEVTLTRFGKAVVELVPVAPRTAAGARKAVLDAVRAIDRAAASLRPEAVWRQDFLHDEEGLPR